MLLASTQISEWRIMHCKPPVAALAVLDKTARISALYAVPMFMMIQPGPSIAAPVAPVLLMRSLPARSHSVSLPTVRTPLEALVPTTLMISRQCDRDEWALICAHSDRSFHDRPATFHPIALPLGSLLLGGHLSCYTVQTCGSAIRWSCSEHEYSKHCGSERRSRTSWQPTARCSKPAAMILKICSGDDTSGTARLY